MSKPCFLSSVTVSRGIIMIFHIFPYKENIDCWIFIGKMLIQNIRTFLNSSLTSQLIKLNKYFGCRDFPFCMMAENISNVPRDEALPSFHRLLFSFFILIIYFICSILQLSSGVCNIWRIVLIFYCVMTCLCKQNEEVSYESFVLSQGV